MRSYGGHDIIVQKGHQLAMEPGSTMRGIPEIEIERSVSVSMPDGANMVYLGYDGYYNVGYGDILDVNQDGAPTAWAEVLRSVYAPQTSKEQNMLRSDMMLIDDCSWAIRRQNTNAGIVRVRWRERKIIFNPVEGKAVRVTWPDNTLDTSVSWKERASMNLGVPEPPFPNVTGILFSGIPANYLLEIWRAPTRAHSPNSLNPHRGRHWRPYRRFVPQDGTVTLHWQEMAGVAAIAFVGARLFNPVTGARSDIRRIALIRKQSLFVFMI